MTFPGSDAPPARGPALAAASSPLPAHARRLRRALPAALVLALALAGCGRKEEAPPAPRPVVAMPVQADAALPAWTLPGEVQARYSTPLSFRVGGKIVERQVRLGDAVTPGQIVARLDPADSAKNAASARAQLSAAQHQLDYARQQLDR
ncbi:MAG: biotin/lipoyl-binding protein, partial [Achromobacter sp.]|nr:biotin/lipoyl-binding protein [Achromobacter sp.]